MADDTAKNSTAPKPRLNLREQLKKWDEKIWQVQPQASRQKPLRRLYGLLRMIVLTIQGVGQNKIPSQAASLSYASIIALAPMVMMAIMISGFIFKDKAEDFAVEKLHQAIEFIAPQMTLIDSDPLDQQVAQTQMADEQSTDAKKENINPQIVQIIENLVKKASSGAMGVVGSLMLVVICIRLLISIENMFNQIWGVRRGRSLAQRVFGYWTVLTLGSILAFAVAGLATGSAIVRNVESVATKLPLGLDRLASFGAPVLALCLLLLLLTCFYRFIPNTRVNWAPAFVGGAVVTILIVLNYYLSFFYVNWVVKQQSFYGSLGIAIVLMFGLYIFWLFMLIGGQITYAVQNMELVAHERAWKNASPFVRQLLALSIFLQAARRFENAQKPYDAQELSERLGAPLYMVNEALTQMCERQVMAAVEFESENGGIELRYQPARPLDKFRVIDLRAALDSEGNSEGLEILAERDEALRRYLKALEDLRQSPELGATMLDLINSTKAT